MQSIWEKDLTPPKRAALAGNRSVDVAVIGAGMAGILTAFLLQKQGLTTLVLETDEIGSGTTGKTTAKITAQHGLIYDRLIRRVGEKLAGQYARANRQAVEQFAALIRREQIDCSFCRVSSYLYGRTDADLLRREAAAASRLGLSAEYVPDAGLPFATVGAVRLPEQGQFHPLKFLYALAGQLEIYCHTPALELTGSSVRTPHGTVSAKAVVLATHYPFVDLPGLYFAKLYQQRSYVLALAGAPELGGIYYGAEDGYSMRDVQNLLLFGGEGHRTGKQPDGDCYRRLERQAKQWFPEARVVARWSAQDCMTLDQLPYVGRYSTGMPDIYLATGFQKWGMTGSMTAATLLCGLLTGTPVDCADAFSPNRFLLSASAANGMTHLSESVRGLSAGLFSPKEHRCTHLGCRLSHNPEEDSWDCPCHGSRFDRAGNLLEGPAQRSIKQTQTRRN